MANKFVDDVMSYIEDDIEKIQAKSGMYISYVGAKGALHLGKEMINNGIDEAANKNSPCNEVIITLDTLEDSLSVEDNGRGIPEESYQLDIFCTKLQSGSKFTREQGGSTAGENGTGLTATNALSEKFWLSTFRNGEEHTIVFEEGKKVDDIRRKSKKEHGTIVKFIPSKKYLGKTARINHSDLVKWVESISYFIPNKLTIKLNIVNGFEKVESYKFKHKEIDELLKSKITDNTLTQVVKLGGNMKLEEDFRGERKIKRELSIQFAFVYTDSIESYIDSYCNFINTTSGGVHLESVKESIWRYLMKATNDSMSDKEKEKYKILKVDIENGLNLVVNMSTDMQMQFVGQTKNEVSNDALTSPVKELSTKALDEYFTNNKSALASMIKIVKANCKARVEMNKIKNITIKEVVNKFDKHKIKKYTPCNNDGKKYKELHLCEGDSAAGSLIDGRDPDTQAFLSFRGLTANPFKMELQDIQNNDEWRTYVTLLKCNIGPKFDLSKLYFDKIIIETDADIDGHGITSGIGAFHAVFLPEIVKAGKLYKSVPPLYEIDDKKHPFVRDKHEYVSVYVDKIIKNFEVYFISDNNRTAIKNNIFKDFVFNTVEYSDELVRLSKHYGVNKFLIEIITAYLVMTGNYEKDIDKFFDDKLEVTKLVEAVQRKFPEITLKGHNSLRGIINGKFQSIAINSRFIKKVADLVPTYEEYGYAMMVKEKDSEYKEMSIGEFLDASSKYKQKILHRFKGLGEINSTQLWDTTLNPDTRILIQLTMEDVERDLRIFERLHGQSTSNMAERKTMMANYKIRRDDLDN